MNFKGISQQVVAGELVEGQNYFGDQNTWPPNIL